MPGRYYGQTLWIWAAIALGLVSAHIPWNDEVKQFFVDSFDWMCLCNTLFASLLMSVKSLCIRHSLRESSRMYLAKIILVFLIIVILFQHAILDEAQLSLMTIMLIAPGMMIKASRDDHQLCEARQMWKQMMSTQFGTVA